MASKAHYLDLFSSVTSDTASDEFLIVGGASGYAVHLFSTATFVELKVETSIDGVNWVTVSDGGYTSFPKVVEGNARYNAIRFSALNISGGSVTGVAMAV